MSKHFELLQKLGKAQQEFLRPTNPVGDIQSEPKAVGSAPADVPQGGALPPGLEQIAALVQQVFLIPGATAPRIVVFTSTEPGTGCTWVSAQVAAVLASRVAGSVCLVDANLRDPALHQQFGVENQNGLADALVQLEPVRTFARSLSHNLWLLGSGPVAEGSPGLLTSDRMRLRITELRSEFDFVLIDTAAMGLSHDAVGLGALCDGVVLVLKANASRREAARQAVQDLQAGNAKVLGAVLNQRTFPIPQFLYKRL